MAGRNRARQWSTGNFWRFISTDGEKLKWPTLVSGTSGTVLAGDRGILPVSFSSNLEQWTDNKQNCEPDFPACPKFKKRDLLLCINRPLAHPWSSLLGSCAN